MASWWLLARHRTKTIFGATVNTISHIYTSHHTHKWENLGWRAKRCCYNIWADYFCALTRCQTPDAKLISNPVTSPNINQHYSDVKNAMWSRLCLCCYSCLIGPIAPILTMLILWKCLFSTFLSASHLLHFIRALLSHNNSHWVSVLAESCVKHISGSSSILVSHSTDCYRNRRNWQWEIEHSIQDTISKKRSTHGSSHTTSTKISPLNVCNNWPPRKQRAKNTECDKHQKQDNKLNIL